MPTRVEVPSAPTAAKPRYATQRNPARKTRGGEVAILANAKGKPLMPHQSLIADVGLEIDPATNNYWYDLVIVTMQRQAGKTKLIGDVADHRCLTLPQSRVWLTAQTGKDASQWMRDEHIETLLHLALFKDRIKCSRAAGAETVRWPNGSMFRVFPPQRDALHGKQGDLIFLDEIWAHDQPHGDALKQAVRPTMLTRVGSQLWIFSTAGDDESTMLHDYVDLGREAVNDPNSRVAYFEWSIPDDADAEDMEVILRHHPAYGYTVTREALEAARKDFRDDVAGWARAYGNRPTHSRVAAFPAGVWEKCGRELSRQPDRVGIGFDVTPSGDRAAVTVSWRDAQGLPWVEVARESLSSDWVADYVSGVARRFKAPVVYDTAGIATLAVADQIARKYPWVKLHGLSTQEFATSCAVFAGAVIDGNLRHPNQATLNKSVQVASRRPILDGGWAWGRKVSSGSIASLVAATAALWAYDHLPAERISRVLTAR